MLIRQAEQQVRAALDDTPAVLITGARQVGKSTLAEMVRPGPNVNQLITLDDTSQRNAALADPGEFIRALPRPAVIDEIQRVPELMLAIKKSIDESRLAGRDPSGDYLLTGSANIWDSLSTPESLAGRIERVNLRPLSQSELLGRESQFIESLFADDLTAETDAAPGRFAYAGKLVRGGYPEVIERPAARRSRWFIEYLSRVLDRDIRDLANVRRPEDLLRLMRLCAARTGGILNLEGMLRDINVPAATGRRYYELLLRSYLVEELPAWGVNVGRAAVRAPKLLLGDSGICAHLVGYSDERFTNGPDLQPSPGNLFEGFLACEMLKEADSSQLELKAFHWRDRNGREVDLLLELPDGAVAGIEFKLAESVSTPDFRHLNYLKEQLGDRFVAGAVLHTGTDTLRHGDRLWSCPASAIWST